MSVGFQTTNGSSEGAYSLHIQSEYVDATSGRTKQSNIRTELNGLEQIQAYCKNNTLDESLLDDSNKVLRFIQKSYAKVENKDV